MDLMKLLLLLYQLDFVMRFLESMPCMIYLLFFHNNIPRSISCIYCIQCKWYHPQSGILLNIQCRHHWNYRCCICNSAGIEIFYLLSFGMCNIVCWDRSLKHKKWEFLLNVLKGESINSFQKEVKTAKTQREKVNWS